MQIPLQITFRDMEPSTAVEAGIREKAGKLERFYDHIISCQVVVEAPHSHHHKGNLYQVRIDMTVPDGKLLVNHEHHHQDHSHEDVYVAIRDAFDAMKRQLEDYARKRRGKTKKHESPAHGRVLVLIPEGSRHRMNGLSIFIVTVCWTMTSISWKSAVRCVSWKKWGKEGPRRVQ